MTRHLQLSVPLAAHRRAYVTSRSAASIVAEETPNLASGRSDPWMLLQARRTQKPDVSESHPAARCRASIGPPPPVEDADLAILVGVTAAELGKRTRTLCTGRSDRV